MNYDTPPPRGLVERLQSDKAVVTYRAVVGLGVTIIMALVGVIGHWILSDLETLQALVRNTVPQIAINAAHIQDQGDRLTHVEGKVEGIDRRVTVIETRQGMK
ncbi:MAG: hypothetical protein JO256_04405 [Alphaproteobacteria bacterium]|nr:hypothetical protein [Alphaproteobacteria bacterium]